MGLESKFFNHKFNMKLHRKSHAICVNFLFLYGGVTLKLGIAHHIYFDPTTLHNDFKTCLVLIPMTSIPYFMIIKSCSYKKYALNQLKCGLLCWGLIRLWTEAASHYRTSDDRMCAFSFHTTKRTMNRHFFLWVLVPLYLVCTFLLILVTENWSAWKRLKTSQWSQLHY